MAPVVRALQGEPTMEVKVCVTAQHREMLDQVLGLFEIAPDYDLDLMRPGQELTDITTSVLTGLRTGNRYSPWPEEMNRRLTGALTELHFAPTEGARRNLLNEGVDDATIHVTGNTVIDALLEVVTLVELLVRVALCFGLAWVACRIDQLRTTSGPGSFRR